MAVSVALTTQALAAIHRHRRSDLHSQTPSALVLNPCEPNLAGIELSTAANHVLRNGNIPDPLWFCTSLLGSFC